MKHYNQMARSWDFLLCDLPVLFLNVDDLKNSRNYREDLKVTEMVNVVI